jgi:hypothetical protein
MEGGNRFIGRGLRRGSPLRPAGSSVLGQHREARRNDK